MDVLATTELAAGDGQCASAALTHIKPTDIARPTQIANRNGCLIERAHVAAALPMFGRSSTLMQRTNATPHADEARAPSVEGTMDWAAHVTRARVREP